MKPIFRTIAATMSILLALASGLRAESDSGPFERFFRSIKRAFNEPQRRSSTHRSSHKPTQSAGRSTASQGSNPSSINSNADKPPNDRNTRTTVRANSKKGEDLRYGIPVPGKGGFVTSPFSPESGYIDVRGFQPGTPVKDPYSGKIILTP